MAEDGSSLISLRYGSGRGTRSGNEEHLDDLEGEVPFLGIQLDARQRRLSSPAWRTLTRRLGANWCDFRRCGTYSA